MSAPDLVPQSERWAAALDDVTCALKNLNEVLLDQEELQPLLQQICEQVTRAVPGVDEATVTLLSKGRPHTAASTSETVTELDRDQYRTGDGPCLRAARTGKTVRVVVDDARREWPQFAEASYAAGMGSFLSSPLRLNQQHAGAINCYSRQGHGFVRLDVRLLQLFTAAAEAILRTHQRYAQVRELAAQLRVALDSRAVIDQAKGILMAARSISAEEAFELLSQQSQKTNVKVRDLAEQLIDNVVHGT